MPDQEVLYTPHGAAAALAEEVVRYGASRVLAIGSARWTPLAVDLPVAHWVDAVAAHVPVAVAERARAAAGEHGADLVLCIGGGSAIGLAKAVALTTGLPIIAVPTTYAGSEATPMWGITAAGRKTTGIDPVVLPRTVVYDASLLLGLPTALAVASGLNALAHGIDSMWAPGTDATAQELAVEGIAALAAAVPQLAAGSTSAAVVEEALRGAHAAARSFALAGSGLHHKICHVLGGMFDLPHATTHAIVLPHVLALNAPNAPAAERRIAAALGAPAAVDGLRELYSAVAAPTALRDVGMPHAGIAEAVPVILEQVPAGNPTRVTADNLTALLEAAWSGRPDAQVAKVPPERQ